MARPPRIDVPGVAQHIVQRGVNRCACFLDNLDREFYLASLGEAATATDSAIHAYVLMTNHVHLLATPSAEAGLSSMMQRLGRCYVRWFNNRHGRTGTLWEGRFKASLVDSESYLLTCYRYIELNPVRARMVRDPRTYPWSSVHANARDDDDPLITPHAIYLALAHTTARRREMYNALLDNALSQEDLAAIRDHTRQGKALGSKRFQDQIALLVGRPVCYSPMGRPRKRQRDSGS